MGDGRASSELDPRPTPSALDAAKNWLLAVRNEDGGWGEHELSASRVVNTAEAIVALTKLDTTWDASASIEYLRRAASGGYAKFTRHFGWLAFALLEAGLPSTDPTIAGAVEWLAANQNKDHGWGQDANLPSGLYTTFLAMRVLSSARVRSDLLASATVWVDHQQNGDGGWPFRAEAKSDACATAYALISLTKYSHQPFESSDRCRQACGFLIEHRNGPSWAPSYEKGGAGDNVHTFAHFTTPWAISALIASAYSPTQRAVVDGSKSLLDSQSESGGWADVSQYRPTVWATSNAVSALVEHSTAFAEVRRVEDVVQSISMLHARLDSITTVVSGSSVVFRIGPGLFIGLGQRTFVAVALIVGLAVITATVVASRLTAAIYLTVAYAGCVIVAVLLFAYLRQVKRRDAAFVWSSVLGLISLLVAMAGSYVVLTR